MVANLAEPAALQLSADEARQLTDEVKADAAALWVKLLELYRRGAHTALGYSSWGAYFEAELKQDASRGYQLLDAARVREILTSPQQSTSVSPHNEAVARELGSFAEQPALLRAIWQEALDRFDGKPTAAKVRGLVNEWRAAGLIVAPATHTLLTSSESVEWYTPAQYLDAARALLGGIDLDPASSELANRTVRAARFYTATDDGLRQPWTGTVFLNPPYSTRDGESNQALWSRRLIEEYDAGSVSAAVLLVNAVPSEQWFAPLWEYPICFTDHRIRFVSAEGEASSPTHSNAFVYLGGDIPRFVDLFSAFGVVAKRLDVHGGVA